MHGPEFNFLKSIDVFAGLEDKLINFLASRLHKKRFRKGEHVFFQGDVVSHFYFLEMGQVEIYKSGMVRNTISGMPSLHIHDRAHRSASLLFLERSPEICYLTPMKLFILLIGMVMIFEGLPYVAAPESMQAWLRKIIEMRPEQLRIFGLISMAAGLFLCWIIQGDSLF